MVSGFLDCDKINGVSNAKVAMIITITVTNRTTRLLA